MMNSSTKFEHLSEDLLVRLLDDELSLEQRHQAEAHLAVCDDCSLKQAALQQFSQQINQAVHLTALPDMDDGRQRLKSRLGASTGRLQHPSHVLRRFGWGMGIAATLAFGILLVPRHDLAPQSEPDEVVAETASTQTGAIEVDGEKFLPVPYANTDLVTAAPHIVQMQVPVSSLTDIGIVLEPVMNRMSSGPDAERSVLADVLIGADGQPRGVHVIGLE